MNLTPEAGTVRPPGHSLLYLLPYLRRRRGTMMLGFLMVVLTVVASMFSPWVLRYVVDDLSAALALEKLPRYAALILGLALVEGFFRFWMRKILIGTSREVEYDLRNDFFAHIQRMPLSFLQGRSTGDIMSRATNDLNAVRSVLGPGIMYSATTLVTVVIATGILLSLSWRLTLLAYIPLALASFAVQRMGGEIHDRFEAIQEQFSRISAKAQENLSGIRVVKSFAREESEIDQFDVLNHEYVQRNIRLIRVWGMFFPLMSALIGLSSVALLWYGGRSVIQGSLTLGEFVAFLAYLALLTWPTIATGWVINIFQRGSASMGRILQVLQAQPDIRDPHRPVLPGKLDGAIEIRNLDFIYPNASEAVLHAINVTIPAGETLAVVGHTGSGKSTLVNLLPRLWDPPPGTVFVDGVDVREWPLAELRRMIGYVPQDAFLFSDTIAANLAFGSAESRSPQAVEWAAGKAQIADEILRFPQGFQTFVGERGITLSGGQKQRVTIGRALAVDPRILILDDSLSSVDTDTEERILENLSEVMKGRTTILVSHRISTVRNAREIIVLQNGRIVERGNHNSLLSLQGTYAELYQKQLLEEELALA